VLFHPNEFAFGAENFGVDSRYHEVADQVIRMPVSGPIVENGKWHRLSVEFTAKGDECFFTVGCFKRITAENVAPVDSVPVGIIVQFGAAYLYDDFVLTEIVEDTATPLEPVVPNVFTPNGDGINDFWVIENLPPGTSLAIYNRWGQQVYISQNYNNDWGGEGLPAGNYIVELVFRDLPPRRFNLFIKR
jgi:gliding motility-associated-like protein